ncbi:MAG: response regulator [Betaproteobacteria bacterium]|nr:response regulator [Betaproteobacteria bacterium]
MARILVVDDELGICELLAEILEDAGHAVTAVQCAGAARKALASRFPDLVLLDAWLPDTNGIELLKEWRHANALTMPVIMLTAHGTIDSAVEATRLGAMEFLEKPISLQKLLRAVQRALAGPKSRDLPAAPSISVKTLGPVSAPPAASLRLDLPFREAREVFERLYFEHTLKLENGCMPRIAERAGVDRAHLYRKLRQLGIAIGNRSA